MRHAKFFTQMHVTQISNFALNMLHYGASCEELYKKAKS